jgi:hypothetical protein
LSFAAEPEDSCLPIAVPAYSESIAHFIEENFDSKVLAVSLNSSVS